MRQQPLSCFTFFGGKARMANLICDLLNYDTKVYLEVFGGAFRTLLNKPRHSIEIYNDGSLGLCACVNLMSQEDTSKELIRRIYKTEYSKEEFRRSMEYWNLFDSSVKKQLKREFESIMKQLLVKYEEIPQEISHKEFRDILMDCKYVLSNLNAKCTNEEFDMVKQAANNYLESLGNKSKEFNLFEVWGDISEDDTGYLNNYDLAVATYVCYSQSRDGMGKHWSSAKYKTQDAYHKQMDRLYDVAERLNGVLVTGAEDSRTFLMSNSYLNDPDAMFYLDPSYIDENDINLGKTYVNSFSVKDHEEMLKVICEAKSNILISNYDVSLYNEYLTPERGWKRLDYETKTGLGREGERERLEVLWYNY